MGLAVGALEPSLPCLAPLPPLPPSTPRAAAVPDLLANSAGRSPAQYHAFFGAIRGRLAASCPRLPPPQGRRGAWGAGQGSGAEWRQAAWRGHPHCPHAPDSNFSILPPCEHRPGSGAAIPYVLSSPSLAMRPPVGAAQRRLPGPHAALRPLSRPRAASSLPPLRLEFHDPSIPAAPRIPAGRRDRGLSGRIPRLRSQCIENFHPYTDNITLR